MARTANRGTMSASSPTSYNVMRWRLGKYIRLSKEDLLRGRDESNSVEISGGSWNNTTRPTWMSSMRARKRTYMWMTEKQVRTPTARTFSGSCPIYPAAELTA